MNKLLHTLTNLFCSSSMERSECEIIKKEICRSFKIREIIHIKEINWYEAQHFAENKAIDMMRVDEMISFNILINDQEVHVLFAPIPTGGIYISAYDTNTRIYKEKLPYVS